MINILSIQWLHILKTGNHWIFVENSWYAKNNVNVKKMHNLIFYAWCPSDI